MILASTTQKLQIVLGGAATSANSPVLVDYVQSNASGTTFAVAASSTNGASPVDILAAPGASTQRRVNSLTVCNGDSAAISVTIRLNDNGTTYDILSGVTLQPLAALQFTREAGWEVVNPSGGVRDLRAGWVQEFKASGTWYKPPNCRFFMVECVGAGGGGGGGSSASSQTVVYSAGGGGGGCRVRRIFLASDLPASVAVTVAGQASGGAGGVNAGGSAGTDGGSSSFGAYLVGFGGGGGQSPTSTAQAYYYASGGGGGGGTAVGGKGGASIASGGSAMLAGDATTSRSDHRGAGCAVSSFLGGAGGAGSVGNNAQPGLPGYSYYSGGAGGSGAGVVMAGTAYGGGSGSTPSQSSATTGGPPIGGSGYTGVRFPGYCGGGGSGGGSLYLPSGNPVGGVGGDGAYPGGGGGGGGGAYTPSGTATGGAGGNGGGGMVRIMGW